MSKDSYIRPHQVTSPRLNWSLIAVLADGEDSTGNGEEEHALALGRWNGDPVLASRWNGTEDRPVGSPQSRGIATWHILPHGPIEEAIIGTLSHDKQVLVRSIMDTKPKS